jgi:hypothetical protein
MKEKGRLFADTRLGAKDSDIHSGDKVLVEPLFDISKGLSGEDSFSGSTKSGFSRDTESWRPVFSLS